MRIINLAPEHPAILLQAATLLVEAFHAWLDQGAALTEVRTSVQAERISRGVLDDHGTLLGWIGGLPQYDGKVWELHPLVVGRPHRRQGIGRALVRDFEAQVKARRGITILLGTDDEDNQTSLSGIDLYPDPLGPIATIQNLQGHPYAFYQKLGFVIIGVVPDANGLGKPDILMAKRVS